MNGIAISMSNYMKRSIERNLSEYSYIKYRVSSFVRGTTNTRKFIRSMYSHILRRLISDTVVVAAICAVTGLPRWVVPAFFVFRLAINAGLIASMFYNEMIK